MGHEGAPDRHDHGEQVRHFPVNDHTEVGPIGKMEGGSSPLTLSPSLEAHMQEKVRWRGMWDASNQISALNSQDRDPSRVALLKKA